jgi:hypothetical protein
MNKGNRWDGEGGMGRVRGSVYCQPGTRVDGNSQRDKGGISK